ncbi:hypothetical protein BT69DRAFT_1291688 [Atractiella rhizophila]|nr:hypothetical protein BT69DRAFT_1291688 [Atractiella rhizophila]
MEWIQSELAHLRSTWLLLNARILKEEIWSDNNSLDDLGKVCYDPYEHLTVLTPTQSPLAAVTPHSHLPDSAVMPPSINTIVLCVQTPLRHSRSEIMLVGSVDEHTLGISGNVRTLFPKLPPGEKEKRKYEWLKTKNGAQITTERIADMKWEAREILKEMYNTPLYCQKTWSKIPHFHRIHGIAILKCKFPKLTQCQGHAMADHVFCELKHRQLENLNVVDRKEVEKKKGAKLKVKENKGRMIEVFPQLTTTSEDILDSTLRSAARSSVQPQDELAKKSETSKVSTIRLPLFKVTESYCPDANGPTGGISTESVKGMLKLVLTDSRAVSNPVPSSAVTFTQKTVLPAPSFGNAMAVNNVVAASASLHAKANAGGAAPCAPPSVKWIQGGRSGRELTNNVLSSNQTILETTYDTPSTSESDIHEANKEGNHGSVKTCGRCKKQKDAYRQKNTNNHRRDICDNNFLHWSKVPYPLLKTNLHNVPLCMNMLGKWSIDENVVKKFFMGIKDGKVWDVDQSMEMINMRVFMAMTWVEEKMDWVLTKERLQY